MKKILSFVVIVMMMFSMAGFTTAEKAYIEDSMKLLDWEGSENTGTMNISINANGQQLKYDVEMKSKGNLSQLLTEVEMNIKPVNPTAGMLPLPSSIKMYTSGGDVYLDKGTFNLLMSVMGGQNTPVNEDYVLIKSDDSVKVDKGMVSDLMEYVYQMDLGIDSGLVKEGNKYSLNMDSDKMIDYFDAYIKYSITNIDKFPKSFFPEEIRTMTFSQEDNQMALEEYNKMAAPLLTQAKEAIKGSNYTMTATIEDNKTESVGKLTIKAQGIEIVVDMKSNAVKADNVQINLPTSVKIISNEDLATLFAPPVTEPPVVQPPVVQPPAVTMPATTPEALKNPVLSIKTDGSYTLPSGVQGILRLSVEDGRSSFNVEDLNKIFNNQVAWMQAFIPAQYLTKYNLDVQWNPVTKTYDFYQ